MAVRTLRIIVSIDGVESTGSVALAVDDTDSDGPATAQGIADLCREMLVAVTSPDEDDSYDTHCLH